MPGTESTSWTEQAFLPEAHMPKLVYSLALVNSCRASQQEEPISHLGEEVENSICSYDKFSSYKVWDFLSITLQTHEKNSVICLIKKAYTVRGIKSKLGLFQINELNILT